MTLSERTGAIPPFGVDALKSVADEMLSGLKATDAIKRRALFRASLEEKVPESAGQMLSGLKATGALRQRILNDARRKPYLPFLPHVTTPRRAVRALVPALSFALVVACAIGAGFWFGQQSGQQQILASQSGGALLLSADAGPTGYSAGGVNSALLSVDGTVPQYRALAAMTADGQPALVSVNGRYYQMLLSPASVPDALLGKKIGDVQPAAGDMALDDRIGVLSNVVSAGEPIYEVAGYAQRTVVAAKVFGTTRLFQRVGYAGKTLAGAGETFEDTLGVRGHVTALELSGVGAVTDPEEAARLTDVLLDQASLWQGESIPSGGQALTLYLEDNLALQLQVAENVLQGCGAWANPTFFKEFQAAANAGVQ